MATTRSYRTEMRAAERRLAQPEVPVADVRTPRGLVRYARFGSGPPVLVLHGSGGGWDQGVDWARRRLGTEASDTPRCDVISPSRFGYPGSQLPDGATVAVQADVLVALLDQLGLDAVAVVALSAGSVTALRLAADHPDRVRRLVLESPVLPLAGRAPLPPVAAVRVLSHAQYLLWLTTRLPALVRLAAGVPASELDDAARDELAAINETTFPLRPRMRGTLFDRAIGVEEVLRDRIPVERISAPTLVVNAAHSVLAPHEDAARFVARLANGRLVELDHGGHVLVGNVARLRALLGEFLTG